MKLKSSLFNGRSAIALLSVITLGFMVSSCHKKPDPDPTPNKKPFKEWLQLNSNGELSKVPIPFAQFGATPDDAKKWEEAFGSDIEIENNEKLSFKTNDPKELNPNRSYNFENGKLASSSYTISSLLILKREGNGMAPADAFEKILTSEGYQKVTDKKELTYANNSYQLTFTLTTNHKIAEVYVTKKGETPDIPKKEFKQWLELNEAGELTKVPIPFTDLSKSVDDIKAWEDGYGSTLYKETSEMLGFNTNDPKGLNPRRLYGIAKNKLTSMAYEIASKLIFEPTLTKDTPNDAFELVLKNEGFKKVDGSKKGSMEYTNDKVMISFSYTEKDKNMTLAVVIPLRKKTDSGYKFYNDVKDFPLLIKDKYVTEYTLDEIKAYEKKVNRIFSEKQSNDKLAVFGATEAEHTNFQMVKYELQDGKNSDGTDKKAGIVAISFSINSTDILRSKEYEDYVIAQGFKFEKELASSGIKILYYRNDEQGVRLMVTDYPSSKTPATMWVFEKYTKKGNDTPTEKRKAFYLPVMAYNAPISENSDIIKLEKERGFTATFKPKSTDKYGERPARIESEPPFDSQYAIGVGKKPGITGFTYMISKELKGDYRVEVIANLNKVNGKNKDAGITELKEFVLSQGFQFFMKGDLGNGMGNYECYYDDINKILLTIQYFMGDAVPSFTREAKPFEAKPTKADVLRRLQYYKNK